MPPTLMWKMLENMEINVEIGHKNVIKDYD